MRVWRWLVLVLYSQYLSYNGKRFIHGKISYDVSIRRSNKAMFIADRLYQNPLRRK